MSRLLDAVEGSQKIPSHVAGAVATAVAALPGDEPLGVAEEVLARVLVWQTGPDGQIARACAPVYARR